MGCVWNRYLRLPKNNFLSFKRNKPKTVFYRCYKVWSKLFQQSTLNYGFTTWLVISRISRDILFQSTLDVFAPYMQKKIRYNNKEFLDIQTTRECRLTLKRVGNMIIIYSHNNNPFMKKKTLKKKIMIRSKLCNKSNKSRTSVHWLN